MMLSKSIYSWSVLLLLSLPNWGCRMVLRCGVGQLEGWMVQGLLLLLLLVMVVVHDWLRQI